MTALLPGWPDAEAAVLAVVNPAVTVNAGTVTPADFTGKLPFALVQRIGGADDGVTDYPVIAVTVFGSSRASAWAVAESCRQHILASPGGPGVLIDSAETVTPSQQVPDPNTNLRVVTATYRLGLRRPLNSS